MGAMSVRRLSSSELNPQHYGLTGPTAPTNYQIPKNLIFSRATDEDAEAMDAPSMQQAHGCAASMGARPISRPRTRCLRGCKARWHSILGHPLPPSCWRRNSCDEGGHPVDNAPSPRGGRFHVMPRAVRFGWPADDRPSRLSVRVMNAIRCSTWGELA